MFARKLPPPTLAERLTAAEATKAAALSVFTQALDDLRVAEAEALDVAEAAQAEMERLRLLAAEAEDQAIEAADKRVALAELLRL